MLILKWTTPLVAFGERLKCWGGGATGRVSTTADRFPRKTLRRSGIREIRITFIMEHKSLILNGNWI